MTAPKIKGCCPGTPKPMRSGNPCPARRKRLPPPSWGRDGAEPRGAENRHPAPACAPLGADRRSTTSMACTPSAPPAPIPSPQGGGGTLAASLRPGARPAVRRHPDRRHLPPPSWGRDGVGVHGAGNRHPAPACASRRADRRPVISMACTLGLPPTPIPSLQGGGGALAASLCPGGRAPALRHPDRRRLPPPSWGRDGVGGAWRGPPMPWLLPAARRPARSAMATPGGPR